MGRPKGSTKSKSAEKAGWGKMTLTLSSEVSKALRVHEAFTGIPMGETADTLLRLSLGRLVDGIPQLRDQFEALLMETASGSKGHIAEIRPSDPILEPIGDDEGSENEDADEGQIALEREIYSQFETRLEGMDSADLVQGVARQVRVSNPFLPLSPEEFDTAKKEVRRWKLKRRIPDHYRDFLDKFFEHRY